MGVVRISKESTVNGMSESMQGTVDVKGYNGTAKIKIKQSDKKFSYIVKNIQSDWRIEITEKKGDGELTATLRNISSSSHRFEVFKQNARAFAKIWRKQIG